MFEKIYGIINGVKLPGIKTTTSFLFFFENFWFYFIPDSYEDRYEELKINRKDLI